MLVNKIAFYLAAILAIAVALAHSWLGEKYILRRLFRLENLPKIFGNDDFTKRTLRFTWHLLSIAWLGFAAILIVMSEGQVSIMSIGIIIGAVFLAHTSVALVGSRSKHLSWPVFLAISVLVMYALRV